LNTYLFKEELSTDLIAESFVNLFPYSRGEGKGFRNFCKGIKEGNFSWCDAKIPGHAGTGSAMRAGVIGMLYYDKFPELLQHAILQSCVTHSDIRSHMASILIAITTGYAMQFDPEILGNLNSIQHFHQTTRERLFMAIPVIQNYCRKEGVTVEKPRERSLQFINSLDAITKFLQSYQSVDDARGDFLKLITIIAEYANEDRTHSWEATGTLNFALESPITAYAVFLLFGNNTKKAILKTIRLGGDTDTVAAMVGQMSGGLVGFHPYW
jgi:ADP-ribosylglycohydrolase